MRGFILLVLLSLLALALLGLSACDPNPFPVGVDIGTAPDPE